MYKKNERNNEDAVYSFSRGEVSAAMMAMGFQGVPRDGTFYWMLYEREIS